MSLLDLPPTTQLSELTNSIGTFTTDLYQQCIQNAPNENVFVSPLSILSALALLSQASNGTTYNQLKNGLHLNGNQTFVTNQFHDYYKLLQNSVGQSNLSIANQIYVKESLSLNPNFKEIAAKKFLSGVESMNFENSTEAAHAINQFVEEKTHDKIKNLIKPGSIDANTVAVLINAIYFKGNWLSTFNKKLTKKDEFYIGVTETVSVDFMSNGDNHNWKSSDELGADILEMKYNNSKFSFLIILPFEYTELSAVESKLKNFDLKKIRSELESTPVIVNMPKFKIEYEVNLKGILTNLGMGEIFDETKADLSGLLDIGGQFFVSEAFHKAFIEVNEEGAEAAAASSIFVSDRIGGKPTYKNFNVNHPFMYYIWDTETETALFAGRIVNFK